MIKTWTCQVTKDMLFQIIPINLQIKNLLVKINYKFHLLLKH